MGGLVLGRYWWKALRFSTLRVHHRTIKALLEHNT